MQLIFDVNRSREANPPKYGKGITFIDRKSGKLKGLRVMDSNGNTLQPRELTLEDGQRTLKKSFTVNNVMYDKEVMVTELCGDSVEELISGYGRYTTFEEMGVDTYFWDVVKFDSPYWKTVWKRKLNATKDHIAKGTPNTEATYIKGLVELKAEKAFDDKDDYAVKEALFDMSNGKLELEDIDGLLKKFRKGNSKYTTIKAMTKKEANAAASALGLPHSGYVKNTADLAWDTMGYVLYGGDLSSKILKMAELYDNYNFKKKIKITGYIQHTDLDEDIIKRARKAYVKQIKTSIEDIEKYLASNYHDMVDFQGFLAQILNEDKSQGGKPRERGLVDVNGKIIIDVKKNVS